MKKVLLALAVGNAVCNCAPQQILFTQMLPTALLINLDIVSNGAANLFLSTGDTVPLTTDLPDQLNYYRYLTENSLYYHYFS